jgi:uncharacterized protein (TIGR03435 family)
LIGTEWLLLAHIGNAGVILSGGVMARISVLVAPALCLSFLTAQQLPPLQFDVASVKPFVPPVEVAQRMVFRGRRGGPGTDDPGQITWDGGTMKNILVNAFGIKNYQIAGPEWINSERYSIVAKVPARTTKEQVLVMWQKLLADRFGLAVHRETREIPIYEVTIAKGGPKLKQSHPIDETKTSIEEAAPSKPTTRADGCPNFPDVHGGFSVRMTQGRMQICASRITIGDICDALTSDLSRPVFDNSGLTAAYDFALEFEPDKGPMDTTSDATLAPTIFAAFQNLGLKIEPKKAPADFVVVDRLEKVPVEN